MTRSIAETYAARGVVVVGIGADGWAGLSESARHALRSAGSIIGSPRQLQQLPVWLGPRREEWRSPRREDILTLIEEHADGGVAVLASGDPLLYGIGRTLVADLGIDRLLVVPNVSSVSLACARLGWPQEDVVVINAPGGGLDALPGHLAEGARVIVLSAGRDTPTTVATRLADQGYGASELTVLGDLGSPREERWDSTASGWDAEVTSGLNVVAVTCHRDPDAPTSEPPTPEAAPEPPSTEPTPEGAPEPATPEPAPPAPATRGQRTARLSPYGVAWLSDLGAVVAEPAVVAGAPRERSPRSGGLGATQLLSVAVLAALDPAPGEILWAVGATDAAAVGWCLTAPGARAILIGADAGASRTAFGMPPVQRVTGSLPAAAQGLANPDAVLFAEPSAGVGVAPEALETAWRALRLGGRLVAVGGTVDDAALLARYHRRLGGDLTRLQLSPGELVGDATRFGPAAEVVLWVRRKIT